MEIPDFIIIAVLRRVVQYILAKTSTILVVEDVIQQLFFEPPDGAPWFLFQDAKKEPAKIFFFFNFY